MPPPGIAADLRTSQRQLGLLWGLVSAALLILAPYAEQFARALPGCTFKAILGSPCPTCGITRATLALAHLEVGSALRVNPLATILMMTFLAGGFVAGISALGGRALREPRWDLRPAERLGIIALVVANWAYLVASGI